MKTHRPYAWLVPLIAFALYAFQQTAQAQTLHRHTAALPATDGLGRRLPTWEEVGDERPDRFVGLFYWTWHTHFAKQMPAFDVTKFLQQHPEALDDFHHPAWGGVKATHFWGEPLFGYYRDTDEWVLRKHAEMLGEAGVDVIIFDCTNGDFLWTESYRKLCEVFTKARQDGVRTPQIAFILAFAPTPESRRAIRKLYKELYKPGLYRDLWFHWKGKPLIMAYKEDLPQEILDFFTFRPGQPTYQGGPHNNEQWGWLETYPQNGYVPLPDGRFEEMPVGVAQNWSAERGLTAMNAPNTFGRSYTHKNAATTVASPAGNTTALGLNFQEQWDRALAVDPEFVFVTGWNEWIAGRYEEWCGQKNAFPDEFSEEKSRDIEPMRGGYGDSYYYQLVANIRRFKGMPHDNASVPQTASRINWAYWNTVHNGFRSHRGNTLHRNSPGWGDAWLTDSTGRNDLVEAKVAHDRHNLYFYVECAADIIPSSAWMRLFIDADCNHATGWEGYDFVVNRTPPTPRTAILERHTAATPLSSASCDPSPATTHGSASGDPALVPLSNASGGFVTGAWSLVANVSYTLCGNKLVITIPKRHLGIARNAPFQLEFKWQDNAQREGDITDFLVSGDTAPLGRFNYVFRAVVP